MNPVLARAVTKRRLGITARRRIAWLVSAACVTALLGGCGEEAPRVSSPTSSTSPTRSPAPSPQKIVRSPKQIAPSPEKSVTTSPKLDEDMRHVIVRYTPDREAVMVKAIVDPTVLSQGSSSFHGYFQAPFTGAGSRYWQWQAIFPMGVREGRQLLIQNAYTKYFGCAGSGLGHRIKVHFTATVNRERGIIRVVFPSRCISEQGVEIPPVPVRASFNLDPVDSYERGLPGVDGAVFTEPLRPGDMAVLRH